MPRACPWKAQRAWLLRSRHTSALLSPAITGGQCTDPFSTALARTAANFSLGGNVREIHVNFLPASSSDRISQRCRHTSQQRVCLVPPQSSLSFCAPNILSRWVGPTTVPGSHALQKHSPPRSRTGCPLPAEPRREALPLHSEEKGCMPVSEF